MISNIFKSFQVLFNKRSITIIFSALIKILLIVLINNVMTKNLDYEEISKYYLVFSIYTFFSTIIIGPTGEFVNKIFFKIHLENDILFFLKSYYKKFIFPVSLISLFGISFLIGLKYGLNNNYFINIPILVFGLILVKTIFDGNLSYLNNLGLYKKYSALQVLVTLLYLFFSYLFIVYFKSNYFFWLLGFILSNFILSLFTFTFIKKKSNDLNLKKSFSLTKDIIYFVAFLTSSNILLWFLTDGFRFFSEFKFGLVESGSLILGLALASQIFSTAANFIFPIFTPELLKGFSKVTKEMRIMYLKSFYKKTLPILFFLFIFTMIFSDVLLNVLVNESKVNKDLKYIFMIGLFIEFLKSLINLIKQYKLSENKLKYQLFSLVLPSILVAVIPFLNFISSIKILSFYLCFVYVIYFIISTLFLFKIHSKDENI